MKPINGIVPVIPIPFDEAEEIDEMSLRRTVEWVAEQRFPAMCLPAYGSEFYKLSEGEREVVVGIALDVSGGRTPVMAQANHGSAKIAAQTAKRYERMGANIISFAVPRLFASTDMDLLRYCGRICDAVSIPVLIQDFNPGGPTIDADFIAKLSIQHGNFRYAKLEEPMIMDKLKRIRDTVGDRVGILEGWGGYYMLEAISIGAVGVMPGVPLADALQRVFTNRQQKQDLEAYDLFGSLLPFIIFALQDFELFLQIEKRLLVRRGLFARPNMRSLTYSLSPQLESHVEFLIDQVMRVLEQLKSKPCHSQAFCETHENEKNTGISMGTSSVR